MGNSGRETAFSRLGIFKFTYKNGYWEERISSEETGHDLLQIGKISFDLGKERTMKKLVPWLFASAAVMLMLPALAVRFVNADSGMAVCLALFFLADPLFSACIGVYAGRDPQRLWSLPIFPAVFFLLGAWLFLDAGETAFLFYAAAYALLGYAAMLISWFIRKKP